MFVVGVSLSGQTDINPDKFRFTYSYCNKESNRFQADKKSGEKKTNLATKAIVDTMTQKKRELMAKTSLDDDNEEITSDEDDVKNGDEKEMAVNVDVLLSEEKNPWIGTSSVNNNEVEMKERMAKLLKGMEEKSAQVNPTDFAHVKEKKLLKVANNGDSDNDDDGEASEDEEKRQQVIHLFFFKPNLTQICNHEL